MSNRDEALTDCWALAQANEKAIKSNGWDTNLMISSQFDWCAALQQIDKATGETFRSYMWSYEEEGEKESKEDMQMFQFRIGIAKSNSFYLSSKGDDAKFVFDQLVEHTEDNEVQEKSKGIYIVDHLDPPWDQRQARRMVVGQSWIGTLAMLSHVTDARDWA